MRSGMASASARARCESIGALAVAANKLSKGERQTLAAPLTSTLCSVTSGRGGAHALSVLSPDGGQGDSHFRRL